MNNTMRPSFKVFLLNKVLAGPMNSAQDQLKNVQRS